MQQRFIGQHPVSPIGLGAMPMSIEGRPDEARSIRTLHAAMDAGITLIDTADAYYRAGELPGHNEELIAKALKTYSGDTGAVLVATKGGHYRSADGGWPVDGRPGQLIEAAKASRSRLGVEAIGLYQLHRPDPGVPFAESIGALQQLLDEGVILAAGVSNVNSEQISQARTLLGRDLVSVQNQFSPVFRDSAEQLWLCTKLGMAFLPWRPLGGLTYDRDDAAIEPFAAMARRHQVSTAALILAWLLSQGPNVIPIPGSTRPETILDSLSSVGVQLSDEEVKALDRSAADAR